MEESRCLSALCTTVVGSDSSRLSSEFVDSGFVATCHPLVIVPVTEG